MKFVDRTKELKIIDESVTGSRLLVILGRRRVGKSRLIKEWLARSKRLPLYTQAIEASPALQLHQVWVDLASQLPVKIEPKTWEDLFHLLSLIKKPCALVIDEFPFLTESDPSLPSRFQRWVDAGLPDNMLVCLLGSSQTLMKQIFLDAAKPLYQRASRILNLKAIPYPYFGEFFGLDVLKKDTFTKYAMVGGIPKYWQFIEPDLRPHELASKLFFDDQAIFENEKLRIFKDEKIDSVSIQSILDAIGLGASKPSQIATLLQAKQTSLSKAFGLLIEAQLITREVPFGESHRNAKRTLYSINDPFLAFHFNVFSPHQTRWHTYSVEAQNKLIEDHASRIFESQYRGLFKDASRYFEANIEIDCIRHLGEKDLEVAEVKYRNLREKEKKEVLENLRNKFFLSALGRKTAAKNVQFTIVDLAAGLSAMAESSRIPR